MAPFTRRSVLRSAALVPLATACARRVSTNRSVAVGAPVDGDVTVPLASAPELARPGGAVVVRPAGSSSGYLVAFTGQGYLAMRAQCPHAGCDVAWVPEDREAECPCHGSRFAGDGTVLNPPATTNLTAYPAETDGGGNVVVHLFAGDGVFPGRVQNGQFTFAVAGFPALARVGGAVVGQPSGFPGPLAVSRIALAGADAFSAVSAVCPHQGCTVLPGGPGYACPCHGSTFDLNGGFVQGPAGAGLLRYPVVFDGVNLIVSTTPT
ncbi:MAG TPA: Rieske (2Fe-2S) protein [Myxococcales bacterium]|nr:Rieske (2Fe-2S) protein [Myxococcales bacterium]HET9751860.1 Rieske (2Fe-2S) protein [Myxococcales bacterium]